MAQTKMHIEESDKSIRVKCYGTLKVNGSETYDLIATSRDEESLKIMRTDNTIFITAIKNCELEIPSNLSVFVEKTLGSFISTGRIDEISGDKVLGNLVVDGAGTVRIEKVGGNCSMRNVDQSVSIEKVGGNVAADSLKDLSIEKLGGNCKLRNVSGTVSVSKVGGNFSAQGCSDNLNVAKVGGNFISDLCQFGIETKVGGDITIRLTGDEKPVMLYAGGTIRAFVDPSLNDVQMNLRAGNKSELKVGELNEKGIDGILDFQLGNGDSLLDFHAGNSIIISDDPWKPMPENGSFAKLFDLDEGNLHNIIHENVQKATQIAEKKIEEAQKRLEEIGKRMDNEFTDFLTPPIPNFSDPMPSSSENTKGVSNEERLLILQMLQEKKISVEEAEKLFKTLEK